MPPVDPALEAARRADGKFGPQPRAIVDAPLDDGVVAPINDLEAATRTLHDRCCPYSDDEDDWLSHGEVGRQRWRDAVVAVQRNARAAALDEAVDELELPGSNATGYYASNNVAGYQEAERHAQVWLSSRAQRIRDER